MKVLHLFRLLAGMCCVVLACLAMTASADASFGLQSFNFSVNDAPPAGSEPGTLGPPDVQAGSHPFQMTTSFSMNQTTDSEEKSISEGAVKDVYMELPPGMVGDPTAVPQCPPKLLANGGLLGGEGCPASTQIGTVTLDTTLANLTVPVFNLVPPPGVLAQFGFSAISEVTMDVSVRGGSDYGVTVGFHNLSEVLPVGGTSLTLWGDPADPAHDPFRGSCLTPEGGSNGSCPTHAVPNAFLTLPTSCAESLKTMIKADSWESPGVFVEREAASQVGEVLPIGLLGCDRLTFSPTVNVQTEATAADSPTGLLIDVSIPQNNSPEGLAEPDLKDTVMALPAGLSINPATADGLTGCAPSQIGLGSAGPPTCPDASKIGAVEIDTPLLTHPLLGSIYLAQPSNNPFGGLLAVYVAAQENGIVAKLAGRLTADPSTGQLTMSLDNVPELPFSDLKLHLFGGPRAALANPSSCGSFTTTTQMTPYSAPDSGTPATPSSTFAINENCRDGFSPTLVAGATSASAGQSTNFTLQVSRADGQQYIKSLTTTLPSGLFAGLNAVPRCGEAQAMEGTCEAASRVGSMVIAAGSGSHPYYLNGQVFLTGPYDGAPFGLSIETPAIAGPFNLGTVIVRAGISVNSSDAHLTIRTDALPTILEGIPLRVRAVYLTIDRSGFMFNPTDCSVQAINAVVASTQGADAAISTPFTVSGCSKLPFTPSLTASTQAKVSGRTGASLKVKLSYPSGDANVKSVKIQLPKQLPAELKTLQKACTEVVFAANPTSCPKESQVGSGIVRTPIFANPLKGVTYLVSHGDEAFPSLVVVLRGEGVTLDMRGITNIHKGILTTTFMTVPDMPISTFELSLPQGPFPVFGTNLLAKAHGSFCSSNLVLPTTILGQNGAKFTQQTKIQVIGCHKVKKAVRPKAKKAVRHQMHGPLLLDGAWRALAGLT